MTTPDSLSPSAAPTTCLEIPGATGKPKTLRCSFCGKSKSEVRSFIAGPSVYICRDCVGLCNDIFAEDDAENRPASPLPDTPGVSEMLDRFEEAERKFYVAEWQGKDTKRWP
jgi:hypothetical protein